MKKVAYLLPIALLLTSCEGFRIGFINEQRSAGIEGSGTSQKSYTESYSYFLGDNVETEGKNVANLTFEVDDGLSDISVDKINEITRCDVDDFFAGAVESFNVGTREEAWLFVGAKSSYSDGYMTLGFNTAISDVIIDATPYYYEDNAWNEEELKIDENVCVAVNSSPYVRLSGTLNEQQDAVNITKCRYHFSENQTQIKIKVGGEKAFIQKISLYY